MRDTPGVQWSIGLVVGVILVAACGSSPRRHAPAQQLAQSPPDPESPDPWSSRPQSPSAVPPSSPPVPVQDSPPPGSARVQAPVPPATVAAERTLQNCPPPDATTSLPRGSSPSASGLHVWRSLAEVPACLRALLPADIDFKREMLAAESPRNGAPVRVSRPALPLVRESGTVTIEVVAPEPECPVCRGVADPPGLGSTRAPAKQAPLQVWRLPALSRVKVFARYKLPPGSQPCPPCLAS